MKASIHEYGSCFEISLVAETLEEAGKITQWATNSTKKLRGTYAHATTKGEFSLSVVVGKRRKHTTKIFNAEDAK